MCLKWLYASIMSTWGYEVIFNDVDVVHKRPPEMLLQAATYNPWNSRMDFVALSDNALDVKYWYLLILISWLAHHNVFLVNCRTKMHSQASKRDHTGSTSLGGS